MINKFENKYFFLSNFYPCKVTYDGVTYDSSEAAFHAQKTLNREDRNRFVGVTPSQAKRLGRAVSLRADWESVKVQIMYDICLAKFTQNQDLREKLLSTDEQYLEEGTYWHDNCWGNCYCDRCKNIVGQNNLGKILMRIRKEIR